MEEEMKDLDYYIEIGAVSVEGIDEDGEFIFLVTEKAKDLAPELWQAHIDYIDSAMLKLYEQGLVEVSYDENLDATFELSQDGQALAKELGLIEIYKHEE
jgi:hypothetical protein